MSNVVIAQGSRSCFYMVVQGAGTAPAHRRLFDPKRFHVVLFDQRGCGQSRPYSSLDENNTDMLIGDMEALRQSLDINKFLLFGGSWGSTLALAYSIAYPEHVSGLILRGIFLGTRPEVDWFLNDMGRFFPEAHDKFVGHLDPAERIDLLTSYFNRLVDSNPAVHQKAAEAWASYETSCSTLRAEIAIWAVLVRLQWPASRHIILLMTVLCQKTT